MTRIVDRTHLAGEALVGKLPPESAQAETGSLYATIKRSEKLIEESKRLLAQSEKLVSKRR